MPTFEQLPCPALVTDARGTVEAVNQELLHLVGGDKDSWTGKPMEQMLPVASRIFLQTHVWPMALHDGRVREVRLQLLRPDGQCVPVFVNCQRTQDGERVRFSWVLFVTVERSRYEQELLEHKQRAERVSAELAQSARFIRTVTDALPSAIAYWDTALRCRFANLAYSQWLGLQPEAMPGLHLPTILGDALYAQVSGYITRALAGETLQYERSFRSASGATVHVLVDYVPDRDANGRVRGFFALVTNISRLREADAAIRLSASVFEATTEGIMVTDAEARILSVNPAFTALTGYSADEAVGRNASLLSSAEHDAGFFATMFERLQTGGLWKGEVWNRRKDGSRFLAQLSISAIREPDGGIARYVGLFSDGTAQWDKEQLVMHMAFHDGLTGLPNRRLLMERLQQLVSMARREPRQIVLMFLDLDGFKAINDTLGHAIGDEVLKIVAHRLRGLLRTTDTVARLGGDEFVLLLDNPDGQESIETIGGRVIAVLNEEMAFGETRTRIGTSIGIAVFRDGDDSAETLLKKADNAMYEAKLAGKNGLRFAQPLTP